MHQSSVNNNVGNIQRGKESQVEQAQLISSSEIRERRELLVAVLIILHRFMASETPAYSPLRNLLGFSFSPLFFLIHFLMIFYEMNHLSMADISSLRSCSVR